MQSMKKNVVWSTMDQISGKQPPLMTDKASVFGGTGYIWLYTSCKMFCFIVNFSVIRDNFIQWETIKVTITFMAFKTFGCLFLNLCNQ